MNFTRDFVTGVYPYHTMMSVFQPFEEGSAGREYKVTTSVQEWCGHVFVQSNRRNGRVRTEVRSYFEQEEGKVFEEKGSIFMEDGIWTSLRLDPWGLPTGEITIVPSSLVGRFTHRDPKPQLAHASWMAGSRPETLVYRISYPVSGRTLAIEIQKTLPYGIQSWKESDKKGLLSSGKLLHRESNIDYWNYGSESKGKPLRSKLGFRK